MLAAFVAAACFRTVPATDPLADVLSKLGGLAANRGGSEGEALSAAAEMLATLKASRAAREDRKQEREERRAERQGGAAGDGGAAADEPRANASEARPEADSFSFGTGGGRGGASFEKDPFEDIVRDFQSGTEALKAERERARQEFKQSDGDLKAGKRRILELERELREEKQKVQRLEIEVKAKKLAKQEAEQAVLRAYTNIAGTVERTARHAMGDLGSQGASTDDRSDGAAGAAGAGAFFARVEPSPLAEAVLWEKRGFEGASHRLRCCDYYDLSKMASPRSIRAITLPPGTRAVLYPSSGRFGSEADTVGSVELFSSVGDMDGLFSYVQSCCQAIQLLPGVEHSVHTSVLLYPEEDFGGEPLPLLPGDHELSARMKVASVRVPAGVQVTLYGGARFQDGSFVGMLQRDARAFPHDETSTSDQEHAPRLPIASAKVRRVQDSKLHGLFVYPEPAFEGRPQFFESGKHYVYPEQWPQVRSARATNQTLARLFTAGGLLTVSGGEDAVDEKFARPYALEVSAICDPPDLCGEHGKCVAPQQCSCSGSYQGKRCNLQNPDGSSAILCERNVVVVGETLPCVLVPRRYNLGCNATSLFIKVRLDPRQEAPGELSGSPLVAEGHLGGPSQERAEFPFDAVFNKTGEFDRPFEFAVFGKAQAGVFVPRISVLDRCDLAGTTASVQCDSRRCRLALRREGSPLRCPRASLRVLLRGRGGQPAQAVPLLGGREAAAEQFELALGTLWPGGGDTAPLEFVVQVCHGPEWASPTLELEAAAQPPQEPLAVLARARGLLRQGHAAQALELLRTCGPSRSCAALRGSVLVRMGRFDEADEAFAALGAERGAETGAAAAAIASAREAADRADSGAALEHLTEALRVAPLAAELRLWRSEVAAAAGDFGTALSDARAARGLHGPGTASQWLTVMGRALFAYGHAAAALHNFGACARQGEEQPGAPPASAEAQRCRELADAAEAVRADAARLGALLEGGLWSEVSQAAEVALARHEAAWPHFGATSWGLEAKAALCIAGHALNGTDDGAALRPCEAVAAAPRAMRERLDVPLLLRCEVARAELLERAQSAAAALAAAEAAEALLGDGPLDHMAAVVRLLRERLLRAAREAAARAGEGPGPEAAESKPKRPEPADLYAVLELTKNATASEIKRAYRKLALKYHPDKNSDPEAVEIFLDVQKAYRVLSDETLRRRYDAGQQDVDDEDRNKNMQPMKFRVVERDRERGIAKVWWYDPNTGEEGFMDMEIEAWCCLGGAVPRPTGSLGDVTQPPRRRLPAAARQAPPMEAAATGHARPAGAGHAEQHTGRAARLQRGGSWRSIPSPSLRRRPRRIDSKSSGHSPLPWSTPETPTSAGTPTLFGDMDQIEAANASLDGSWSPDCEREGRAVDAADAEQVQDAFDLLMGCFSLPAEEGEPAARGHAPARRGLEHQASSSSLLSFSDRDNHIGLEQTGESRTWDKHSSRSICTETEREAERLAALARVQLDRLGDDGQVGSWGDAAKALRRLLDTKAPRGPEQLAELRETARIFAREALSKKIFSFRYKQRNHEGRAVHIAAIHRDGHSLMAELLDLGVDPTTACTFSAFDNPCSATALHLAAGCGHTEVLRQLLQASVDVNARSTSKGRENYTALHEASFFQQTSAVEFLLRASAQPDARNISLRTPLHVAAQQGSPAVAQALLGKDPSLVCEEDHQRDTPLMVAIEHGRFPAVKLHMLCERTIEDVLRVAQVSPAAAAVLMRAGTDVDEVHHVWRKVLRGRVTVAQWVELMERAPAAAEDVLEALTQAPRVNGRSSNLVPRQAVFRNMEPLRCEYQPETTWSEEVKRWHLTLAPQDIRAWWGRPSAEQKQKGQAVHPERASALPSEEQGPQGPLPVGQRPKRSSSNVSLLRSLTMLADNLRGQPKMVPVRVKVVRLPGIMSYQVLHALATTSHLHVFSKLPVRAIVEHAWRSTVRMSYMYSIFLRVITLCILIISVMPPDFAESEIYRRAAWSYLCAHALEELQYELCEMYGMLFVLVPAASGRSSDYCVDMLLHVLRFFWRAYLTNYKNMFDASSIGLLLVLLAISMDSLRLDTWPSVLALVSAARWFQFMYTLRAFKMWGYRLLPLIHSLVPLSGILCITVFFFLGCLQAFLVLDSGTRSFSDIFVAMFRFLFLGDLDDQDTALEILRAYGTGFTLVFFAICIFFNIFILNLFITTTGEAYDKAQELCMTSFQQERANICLNYMLRPSVECMRKAWKERWHLWLMTTVGLLLLLPLWYALVLAPGVPVLIPAIVLLAFNVLFDAIVVRHPWQNCLDGCKDNRIWICHRADYCETDYWPSERSGPRVTSGRTASLKQDNMQRTNRHMSELSSLRHRQCKLQSLVEHDVAERLSGMELRLDQLLGMLKPESALAGTMDEGSLRRELPRKGTAIGSLGFSAPGSPLGASEGSPLRLARESSRPRLGGKPDHEIAAEEPPGAGGPRAAPAQEPPQQQCGPRRPALQQPRRPQHRLPPVLPPQLPAPPPEPPADVGAAHRGRERVN